MHYAKILEQCGVLVKNSSAVDNFVVNHDIFENIYEYATTQYCTTILEKDGTVMLFDDDYDRYKNYLILSHYDKIYIVDVSAKPLPFIIDTVNADYDDIEATANYIAYIVVNHFLSSSTSENKN